MSIAAGEVAGRVDLFPDVVAPARASGAALRYRADIDGLRTIAVLPVVLFHYQIAPFTGGFVGVDVFFVISGYLITSLIWNEMAAGTFSVLRFYERRIRRIFPALFLVLAATAVAGSVILFPHTLVRYALSLLATAGFISNFHFWGDSGYWAAAAGEKPLLHTWSLAIEEQFYLLFPGVLWLLRRLSRERVLWVLGGALAASLALSVVGVFYAPISTFYLLPTRFWELLVGCVLAVANAPAPESRLVRNGLSIAGVALIGWSTVTLTSSSLFPGANAIPPCLGAALIIYAGSGAKTAVNSALAMRVPVFIGLISYSLYLWHWPIWVFANEVLPVGLNAYQKAACIAASVVLAVMSWRYVEQPFRGKASPISRRMLFAMAGGAIAVSAAVGLFLWQAKGLPQRYDPATQTIVAAMDDHEPLRKHCFDFSPRRVSYQGLCRLGSQTAPATFVLWGDSHADAMVPAVASAALRRGKAGLLAAHGHCAPLVGVTFDDRICRPFNDAVLKVALQKNIDTVLLDAKWAAPAGEPSLSRGRIGWNTDDSSGVAAGPAETRAVFARSLNRTVGLLTAAGKKVIIVGPAVEFRGSVPNDLAKMRVWGAHWEIAPTRAAFVAREAYAYSVFEQAAKKYHARIVRPDALLCPGWRCAAIVDGRPLYRDNSHLSTFGAKRLAPLFDGLL